ncbi:MAG: rRNA maturation RNase YbeY [Patescibacteria group bacterium]
MRTIYDRSLSISTTLKSAPRIDSALFERLKNKVLGKDYELSLVFVGRMLGKRLNREHRNKDYVTDILSFPLDKNNGEIFINPDKARSKSKEFDRNFSNYLQFIFIHGLFHLKGFDHGSRMESEEAKVRDSFNI